MRSIRWQTSPRLLRRRVGPCIREGWQTLRTTSHDGLQWTEPWLRFCRLLQQTGRPEVRPDNQQPRNP